MVEDWENYGHYYVPTLQAWYDRFNGNWEKIKKTGAAPAETPAEVPTGPEGDAEPMTLA